MVFVMIGMQMVFVQDERSKKGLCGVLVIG
jgi:hypothetical protein